MRSIGDSRLATQNFPGNGLRLLDASGNGITTTAASACNNLNQLSISLWFRPLFSTTSTARIFYKGNASAALAWFDVYLAFSTGRISIQAGFTTQGVWNVQQFVALNRWHHIVITYDGSSVSNIPVVYLDGQTPSVTVGTAPVGTRAADTSNLMVGRGAFAATRYLPGLYRSFRLYNRIVNATEADLLYRFGKVPSGVVLEYLANEGTGTTLNDTSGSGNGNGTIVGGSWVTGDAPSILRSNTNGSRNPAPTRQVV